VGSQIGELKVDLRNGILDMRKTLLITAHIITVVKRESKVHPCTGTEALYRPYGLYGVEV
jgi:hypothetical protein